MDHDWGSTTESVPQSNPSRYIDLFGFRFWRERSGVISETPVWCVNYGCWFIATEKLSTLLWLLVTEYKSDRHLIG